MFISQLVGRPCTQSLQGAPLNRTTPLPRGGTLAKFGLVAAHPMHPGGGDIYPPTGRAPMRWESLRRTLHLHAFPPRGEPLNKFGTAAAHTKHPGGGKIYPPTGQAHMLRDSPRGPPHPHAPPPPLRG